MLTTTVQELTSLVLSISDEWLAGFHKFAHLIMTILQILKDTAAFMVVLFMMLVGFALSFYSLFAHGTEHSVGINSTQEETSNTSWTEDVASALDADSSQQERDDIAQAYGSLGLSMLSSFKMLFYDLDTNLFFLHRFPVMVFAVFIAFAFLAIIVMLNLLIVSCSPLHLPCV